MITADAAVMLSTPDSLAVQFAMGRVDQAIREAAKQYRSSAEVSFNTVGYPGSEDLLQISW